MRRGACRLFDSECERSREKRGEALGEPDLAAADGRQGGKRGYEDWKQGVSDKGAYLRDGYPECDAGFFLGWRKVE